MTATGRGSRSLPVIEIQEAGTGMVLARGVLGRDVVKYQGGLYFRAEAVVARESLRLTERTARSATLGVSRWLDLVVDKEPAAEGGREAAVRVRGVGWVYEEPGPGHEVLRGRYGFHPGRRGMTRQVVGDDDAGANPGTGEVEPAG